jgi:hypothetical protein
VSFGGAKRNLLIVRKISPAFLPASEGISKWVIESEGFLCFPALVQMGGGGGEERNPNPSMGKKRKKKKKKKKKLKLDFILSHLVS